MEYVKNTDDTLARLGELVEAIRWAEYEATAAVALLRVVGTSWETIGTGMGFAEGGRKQGASQWFKRNGPRFGLVDPVTNGAAMNLLDDVDPDTGRSERARLARVLGLGEAKSRYQVRIITAGKKGVTKVVYRVVSTHLSVDVARQRAAKLQDETAQVWRIDPDGSETQVSARAAAKATAPAGAALGVDEPF